MKAQCSYFLKLSSHCLGRVTPLDMVLSLHSQVSGHKFTVSLLSLHKWNYVRAVYLVIKALFSILENLPFAIIQMSSFAIIRRPWLGTLSLMISACWVWVWEAEAQAALWAKWRWTARASHVALPQHHTIQLQNATVYKLWPAYSPSREIILCYYYPILPSNTQIFNYFLEQTTERIETRTF